MDYGPGIPRRLGPRSAADSSRPRLTASGSTPLPHARASRSRPSSQPEAAVLKVRARRYALPPTLHDGPVRPESDQSFSRPQDPGDEAWAGVRDRQLARLVVSIPE